MSQWQTREGAHSGENDQRLDGGYSTSAYVCRFSNQAQKKRKSVESEPYCPLNLPAVNFGLQPREYNSQSSERFRMDLSQVPRALTPGVDLNKMPWGQFDDGLTHNPEQQNLQNSRSFNFKELNGLESCGDMPITTCKGVEYVPSNYPMPELSNVHLSRDLSAIEDDKFPMSPKKLMALLNFEAAVSRPKNPVPRLTQTGMHFGGAAELLRFRLISLAEAFSSDDEEGYLHLVDLVKQCSDQYGNVNERLAYFVLSALKSRQEGKVTDLTSKSFASMSQKTLTLVKSFLLRTPYVHMGSLSATKHILDTCHGQESIHIIDFGLWPTSWTYLLQEMSSMNKSRIPALVKWTSVEIIGDQCRFLFDSECAGMECVKLASELGIRIQFQHRKLTLDSLTARNLQTESDQVLVVNCACLLSRLSDETVLRGSPRDRFIKSVHSLHPTLLLVGEMDSTVGSMFFLPRFSEALDFYATVFDMMDSVFGRSGEQFSIEEKVVGKELCNVLSAEGLDRKARFESSQLLCQRMFRAGFAVQPMGLSHLDGLQRELAKYGSDFGVHTVSKMLQIRWKGEPLFAHSAWRLRQ